MVVTTSLLGDIVPRLIKELSKYSEIKLEFKFENSTIITELVNDNKIDIGIVVSPVSYPELVTKKLWNERIGLYSKDGKPKAKLLYNNNMVDAQKLINTVNPEEVQQINDYDILYSILKRNSFMGLLPNPIAEQENKLIPIKEFKPDLNVSYTYRNDRNKTKAFNLIINALNSTKK